MISNPLLGLQEMQLDPAAWAPAKSLTPSADRGEAPPAQEGGGPPPPLVHRGFLNRARSVPVEAIYAQAEARGKRLVLCGHSLGGAVAALCTVSLLAHLPRAAHARVSCYGFATPAVANGVLADICREAGWDNRIRNYLMPGGCGGWQSRLDRALLGVCVCVGGVPRVWPGDWEERVQRAHKAAALHDFRARPDIKDRAHAMVDPERPPQ